MLYKIKNAPISSIENKRTKSINMCYNNRIGHATSDTAAS